MPKSIQLKNFITGESGDVVTLRKAAWDLWLEDHRWQDPMPNFAYYEDVVKEFDKREGEKLRFSTNAWDVLVGIIKTPGRSPNGLPRLYAPSTMVQLKSFRDLILDAKLEDTTTG